MRNKKKEPEEKVQKTLTIFKQFSKEMVANSPSAYRFTNSLLRARPHTPYTKEEALRIIQDGDPEELRELLDQMTPEQLAQLKEQIQKMETKQTAKTKQETSDSETKEESESQEKNDQDE